jgi:hypothetical protein
MATDAFGREVPDPKLLETHLRPAEAAAAAFRELVEQLPWVGAQTDGHDEGAGL